MASEIMLPQLAAIATNDGATRLPLEVDQLAVVTKFSVKGTAGSANAWVDTK